MRNLIGLLAAVVLVMWQSLASIAEPVFETKDMASVNDLTGYRGVISSARPAIAVEVPQSGGTSAVLNLDAKGPGPEFVWSLYSFGNAGSNEQNLVISVPYGRFAGSGVLLPKSIGSSVVQITTSDITVSVLPVTNFSADAVSFTLPAGRSITIAVEGQADTPTATLWHKAEFEHRISQMSFARGAMLGISLLVAMACLALVSLRPHRATLAGAGFAIASVLFMAHENGLITQALGSSLANSINPRTVTAIAETLLLIAAAVALYCFSGISKSSPPFGIAVLALAGIGLANLVLATVEPERATTVARMGFALTAVIGFPIMLKAREQQALEVEGGVLFWLALLAWTFLAGVLALVTFQDPRLSILLQAGLCSLLITLAYILVRFSFGEGYLAKAHLTDQVRRSLALAGARHFLWDWSPAEGDIEYSEEFGTSLGYRGDILEDGGQELFIELLHPEDRTDFVAAADAIAAGAARHIEQELRLKSADGYYRWFALRARTLPGKGTAVLRCIGTLTDISKSKELEQRLLLDSVHDPVTGLPSRAIFMDRLHRSAANKNALPVHVHLIDLDRFKNLNDGLGHDIGDELLRVTGQRIAEVSGTDATAARMAGSQFAVLFTVVGKAADPLPLAEAICEKLSDPIEIGGRMQHLTASIGISLRSAYGVDADTLLNQAASALHAAHDKGPGTIVIYDATMRDDRAAEVALESDLRRAIGRAEIEVHYQPIMQLTTLDIVGFEALARWRHPELGLVAPENFIDTAERVGLINDIGHFMLTEASRQLGLWQRTMFRNRPIFVAVNVSATQLLEADFLSHIQHILSRELLQAGSLKIEVTESVVMRYPERVERLFNHLRAMGIGLSCDDFGTGFSSLSSLRELPFDTLKIDRSFVSGDEIDERTAHIVQSIVGLAHGLGMAVVSEGIETQEQIDQLAALGCDYGQGFFLGSPVSAKEIEAVLSPPLAAGPANIAPQGPFASTALSNVPFAPPPGLAPMAPRVTRLETVSEPDSLPSIFEMSPKPKRRGTKKKASRKKSGRPKKVPDLSLN